MKFAPHALAMAMVLALWGASAATAAASGAAEAGYPSKPIRIVVTFPPGGSGDALIRLISPKLTQQLGQQVIIDNRPGAGGNIGLNTVAKAAPDGYTLGLGAAGALSANVHLYPQMPFDPIKDLAPISMVASIPFVLVAHPSAPVKTLRELVSATRAEPGKWSVGHGGNGTAMHLTSALFAQMGQFQWTEVAYRGTGPATTDVLAGQVPVAISDVPASLQLIRGHRLKPLAVTSAVRLSALPDVPTAAEAGLPGYESVGWFGLVAPAGTPAALLKRVSAELKVALDDPAVLASIRNLGVEPQSSTPEAFGRFIQSETQKWGKVIKAANIQLN